MPGNEVSYHRYREPKGHSSYGDAGVRRSKEKAASGSDANLCATESTSGRLVSGHQGFGKHTAEDSPFNGVQEDVIPGLLCSHSLCGMVS